MGRRGQIEFNRTDGALAPDISISRPQDMYINTYT